MIMMVPLLIRFWMMTYMGPGSALLNTTVTTFGGIPFRVAGINNQSYANIKQFIKNGLENPK